MSSAGYTPLNDTDDENNSKENKGSERKTSLLQNVLDKTGYPTSVWFILGNEFCERFSYYGMHAILVIYLTHMLKMDDDSATAVYHTFNMLCYFSPLLGAILADSWLGKYKTILYVSIIYAIGNIVVAVTSIPAILAKVKLTGVMIGLLLIAVGTGGIKPCVSAFGGDQFTASQERLLQSFFSIFYFAINLGSLLSMIITPILRGDVNCFGNSCYPLAFGVPALLMITSVALFWCGRKKYKKVPPEGNVVMQVSCAVGYAIKKCICSRKDKNVKKEHWMDWAEDKYGTKMVSDIKALLKVLFMFLPMPVFWTLFDQQGSRWTLQAEEMDGDIGALGTIKPDQVQALNPVFILVLIPIFEYIVYPLLAKCNFLIKPLQRMCAGMFLAAVSFVFAAFLQIAIQNSRIHVVAPPNGYANLKIINAAQCDLKIAGTGLDATVSVDEASTYFHVPATLDSLKVESQNCPSPMKQTFPLKIQEHSVDTFVIGKQQNNLVGQKLTDPLAPLKAGIVKVRFVYFGGNIADKVDIQLNKTLTYHGVSELMSNTNYTKILSNHYNIRIRKANTSDLLLKKQLYFGNGGVFTVVVREDPKKPGKLEMTQYTDIRPMSISMLWQVPQYLTLTSGEVLFSITGLEFAYSQSPLSMKSCIMAGWLLTVSIGNAIVVIFAEARITDNMANEFFFFSGLLAIVLIIFMIMSYFYKYEYYSVNGVKPGPDDESHPLTEKTDAAAPPDDK
ncbi:solute carrier family 15 member 1-like [Actinia tenebrosa]|uniref:Solute carrier family 15 member 1-like n=1 Tax=Actinia tenebrosa TaxID=6105 RepID=A0A6P8H2H6_ACTTE|nr:solute carrier family 15 member 1-like [Actinia tenebrosa]